jgi:hypothetical protein
MAIGTLSPVEVGQKQRTLPTSGIDQHFDPTGGRSRQQRLEVNFS